MFDVLWHMRGGVRLRPGVDQEQVLTRVEALLRGQKKTKQQREAGRVAFRWGLFTGTGRGAEWFALMAFDHGQFWIEHDEHGPMLRYDLCSLHLLIFVLGFGLLMAGGSIAHGEAIRGVVEGLLLVVAGLYGANMALAYLRVRPFLRGKLTGLLGEPAQRWFRI